MNINQINSANFQPQVSSTVKANSSEQGFNISDGFKAGIEETIVKTDILKQFSSASQGEKAVEAADVKQVDDNEKDSSVAGRIFRVTTSGVEDVERLSDGGFLVDKETGTSAYFGNSAKDYLENTTNYNGETEIVIPDDSVIEMRIGKRGYTQAESGAILIGPGTEAKVKVKEGLPLVIHTDKAPDWYEKVTPNGPQSGNFEKMAELNQNLLKIATRKQLFQREDLQTLMAFGIVNDDPENGELVKWDEGIKDDDQLSAKLIEAGFTADKVEEQSKIWYDTVKRKLLKLHCGRISKEELTEKQVDKLLDSGAAVKNSLDNKNIYWSTFFKESEFRAKMAEKGMSQEEIDDVTKKWEGTTRSGYDHTGLAWDGGNIVAYSLRDKLNMWSEGSTEWIVNSTAYAGKNDPFTVGVSYVNAKKPYMEPTDFHKLRPQEKIHRHPIREEKKQTECYLVNKGKAVLLTMKDDKPQLNFMEAGDMAVIDPGVAHCVLAVSGDYEHLCYQVPSAFQYGFLFKDELNYEDFSTDHTTLLEAAKAGLEQGKHGTLDAHELIAK